MLSFWLDESANVIHVNIFSADVHLKYWHNHTLYEYNIHLHDRRAISSSFVSTCVLRWEYFNGILFIKRIRCLYIYIHKSLEMYACNADIIDVSRMYLSHDLFMREICLWWRCGMRWKLMQRILYPPQCRYASFETQELDIYFLNWKSKVLVDSVPFLWAWFVTDENCNNRMKISLLIEYHCIGCLLGIVRINTKEYTIWISELKHTKR